jgi:hypothetical protein
MTVKKLVSHQRGPVRALKMGAERALDKTHRFGRRDALA